MSDTQTNREAEMYRVTNERWGMGVEVTVEDVRDQAKIFGLAPDTVTCNGETIKCGYEVIAEVVRFYMDPKTGDVYSSIDLCNTANMVLLEDYEPFRATDSKDDDNFAGTFRSNGYWRAHTGYGKYLDGANIPEDHPRSEIVAILREMVGQ